MVVMVKINKKMIKIIKYIERKVLPDKIDFSLKFRRAFGRWINWENPKSFNEKIIWRIIYDKNPIYTLLSDKYSVRDYVKEKIGGKYLVPLLFVGEPKDIDFSSLKPPFIIKTNHTVGNYCFVGNSEIYKNLDKKKTINYFSKMLKKNYYVLSREWQYKNIMPLVIVEKFLLPKKMNEIRPLSDYKFHCFNGKVAFISVDFDKKEHKEHSFEFLRCCFDREGNCLPFTYGYEQKYYNTITDIENISKKKFNEMINVAERLSNGFDYVRVDLYCVDEKVYFGEFTFTPTCGFGKFNPAHWDYHFGSLWKIKNEQNRKNKHLI